MGRRFPELLLLIAVAGCASRVGQGDLGEGDGDEEESTLGTVLVNTRSVPESDAITHLDMEIERVEIHLADEAVADETGGEWIVLSEELQTVTLVEAQPQVYEIAEGEAPESDYDKLRFKVTRTEVR